MAFLVATFIVFVVSERAVKAKQAQFIAGIGATNFWLSTFLWDAMCFIIPSILIIVVVEAFQTGGYSDKDVVGLEQLSYCQIAEFASGPCCQSPRSIVKYVPSCF